METGFTNDIILVEETYTFAFLDCTITNLNELAGMEAFKRACEVFSNPHITYDEPSDRIDIMAGDKKKGIHIHGDRIDITYFYDEPLIEETGIFRRVKEMRVRSFFESFRKGLLTEKVLTCGPPKGAMAIEAEMPGGREEDHTPGHHVYHIDFK